jgi:uncharacterized GH25 family protein
MKKIIAQLMLVCLAGAAVTAEAHRAWLLPYETVKAGESGWVTFDLASSNDIFQIDHAPGRSEGLSVLTPDGKTEAAQNIFTGKLRTSFDVNLLQQGTYKIFLASGGLNARWETADGKRGSWPERGAKADPAEFATAVPKDAKNVQVTQGSRRVETFVTLGKPSVQALAPTNVGLELVPITHPNDLAVSEPAEFKFLIDGKPAAGVKVTVIAGGTRYRNAAEELELEADKNGIVKIQWKAMGVYWLGASYKDDKAQKPAKSRTGSYSATFEVLAE